MYKIRYPNGQIIKKYTIIDIYEHILKYPNTDCVFFYNYTPYSKSSILKCFLSETKNYTDYLNFYYLIHNQISIIDYAKKSN